MKIMRKKLKKVAWIFIILSILNVGYFNASAVEIPDQETIYSVTVPLVKVGSSARESVTGNVGSASIYFVGLHQIHWQGSPFDKTALVTFDGRVTIWKGKPYEEYKWQKGIFSAGVGTLDGIVEIPSSIKGGYFSAVLEGGGTVGNAKFAIEPGCQATDWYL